MNLYEWDGFACLAENEDQARELLREQVKAGTFIEGYDPSNDPVERVYTEPSFVLYTC